MTEPRVSSHESLREVSDAATQAVARALEARKTPIAPTPVGLLAWPTQGGDEPRA
jgi:hypothetical protein